MERNLKNRAVQVIESRILAIQEMEESERRIVEAISFICDIFQTSDSFKSRNLFVWSIKLLNGIVSVSDLTDDQAKAFSGLNMKTQKKFNLSTEEQAIVAKFFEDIEGFNVIFDGISYFISINKPAKQIGNADDENEAMEFVEKENADEEQQEVADEEPDAVEFLLNAEKKEFEGEENSSVEQEYDEDEFNEDTEIPTIKMNSPNGEAKPTWNIT